MGRRKADTPLIKALAEGRSVAEAAEIAGMSERTAWRRLEDPEFNQEVKEARTGLIRTIAQELRAEASGAVATLAELRDKAKGDDGEGARIRAAISLLTEARQWQGTIEIQEELKELSGLVEELTGDHTA